MSEFVNYYKRGVQLPPGCKDLIDVLRLPSSTEGSTPAMPWKRGATVGGQSLGRLSDVPRFVSILVTSRSKQASLLISTTDERLPILLYRSESEGISAVVLVSRDAKGLEGIREFFRRHGIETLKEDVLSGAASMRVLSYPLPAGASQASQIIADLLCSVYGFTGASVVRFRYFDEVD